MLLRLLPHACRSLLRHATKQQFLQSGSLGITASISTDHSEQAAPHRNRRFLFAATAAVTVGAVVLAASSSLSASATTSLDISDTVKHLVIDAATSGKVGVLEKMVAKFGPQLLDHEFILRSSSVTIPVIAAMENQVAVLEFVAKHAPSRVQCLERPCLSGITPVMVAAEHGHLETLKFLIAHAPSKEHVLESVVLDESSPALVAASQGHLAVLQFIVAHAPSGNKLLETRVGVHQMTPASATTHIHILEYIMAHAPSGVKALESSAVHPKTGATLATKAAHAGDLRMLRFLASRTPSLLTKPDARGFLPLHVAVQVGNLEVVKLLVAHTGRGALETEIVSSNPSFDGFTPALLAAGFGHVGILAFLAANAPSGAAVLETPRGRGFHWSPAYVAALRGNTDALRFIVAHAPSKSQVLQVRSHRIDVGGLPIHAAARAGHLDTVRFLLEEQHDSTAAALHERDANGDTPLSIASSMKHAAVVAYMEQVVAKNKKQMSCSTAVKKTGAATTAPALAAA